MAIENNNTAPTGNQHQVIVVMVPLAAQGHLNQLLHLSRLISAYDIPVHYVTTSIHIRQAKTRVHGWDPLSSSNIFFHELSPPPIDSSLSSPVPAPDPSTHSKIPTHLFTSLDAALKLREPIADLMKNLSNTTKRLVVIHDELMSYQIQDVATFSNAESYCFYSISVFALYTYIWEMFGKPNVPESEFLANNLPSNEGCFAPEFLEYAQLQREFKKFNKGNVYNTCREIEGRYIDLVAQALQLKDNHWAVGPFHPLAINSTSGAEKSSTLRWLDQQPINSVIFVSFGTTTSFTDEEIKEMAEGLEKSGQQFIWILRDADTIDIFYAEGGTKARRLPEGYEERIKGRGMVIRDWAPQLEILGHPSTGGFMSHCGWNSTIESISYGVPIAAWPMHADQPRNGVLITEVLKMGIIVRDWENRGVVVKSETIENAVRRVMDSKEGEEMRKRGENLRQEMKKTVVEGGHSHNQLESFISHIRRF